MVTVNLPECEHPEDFLAWLTPPGYAGPLPEFTLAPKPEKEDPGKTFAGPYDLPGYLRPGFDMLRKLVHKYITYFPKGITLQEFSKESGLSQPKVCVCVCVCGWVSGFVLVSLTKCVFVGGTLRAAHWSC